ncbi:MAG TPA: PmoA family protein [Bryobacteraceae bacterium]|nr:PmoA family protein [Bryobacteraceae bacterium]
MKTLALALIFAASAFSEVKVTKAADRATVEIGGKPFTTFLYAPDTRKPYLYPIFTGSGKPITRHFPMEKVAGETNDHPHHRGLWFSHGDVNGFNFWENEASYENRKNMGTIILDRVLSVKSGKKEGSFSAIFNWLDTSGKKLMTEKRTMTFRDASPNRIIDIDVDLHAVEKIGFGDTKEGTFALRLADSLAEKKTGTMVNAEGARKMKDVWGKKSPWVDYSGDLDGEKVGVTMIEHPANPSYPTRWHARDYGLFAANPFGQGEFEGAKTAGPARFFIEPGKNARFRYRVVIHPGDAASAKVAELAREYK